MTLTNCFESRYYCYIIHRHYLSRSCSNAVLYLILMMVTWIREEEKLKEKRWLNLRNMLTLLSVRFRDINKIRL